VKEPDFDPRFAVGSKNYNVVQREKIIFARDQEFEEKGQFLFQSKDFFNKDYGRVKSIVKQNDYDFNDKEDLVALVKKLNQRR
jgi:hypothetical protein